MNLLCLSVGKGVFTTKPFQSGDFLLQYKGEHIDAKEGERREEEYSDDLGSFMFYFQWDGKTNW